jgi:transketolase
MNLKNPVHAKAIELGKEVLRMTTAAGSGHPSSGLSILHICITLMEDVMRWDAADPWNPDSDRLVLSEGHAVPGVYAVYADCGGVVVKPGGSPVEDRCHKLSFADLATLRETDSPLDGHPNPAEGFPFFDAATGSLGQGLSVGAGLAIAARLRSQPGAAVPHQGREQGTGNREQNVTLRQIYVLIGDGESREGQIWEAMDFIADHGLTNVVPIFNCNGQGQADYVSRQQSAEMIAAKAEAFGFTAIIIDGHDADAIKTAIGDPAERRAPLAIIARTQKGWGCASLKDVSNHGKPLAANQLEKGIADLDSMYAALNIERPREPLPPVNQVRADHCANQSRDREGAGSRANQSRDREGAGSVVVEERRPHVDGRGFGQPALRFADAMAAAGLSGAVEKNAIATRRAYGAALLALGAADERIVALDGDVRNSTFSEMFSKKYPERFIECKIAEQNMISTAVGLAAGGFIPFVSSFAKFIARAYDQIEMAQITRANIKLCGSHAGVTLAADGPSQMSLHDVAYFRSATLSDSRSGAQFTSAKGTGNREQGTGNRTACVVFHPADAVAAFHCTLLMAHHEGMCYMRTHRPDVPLLYKPDTTFEIGGSHILAEGSALTIVAAGYMAHECRKALELLAKDGTRCTLIDGYSFPLDTQPIFAAAARTHHRILCVEDNYLGGLGSAVAEDAAATGDFRVASMTCRRIPKSAKTTDEILAYVGLSAQDIAARVAAILQ